MNQPCVPGLLKVNYNGVETLVLINFSTLRECLCDCNIPLSASNADIHVEEFWSHLEIYSASNL